MNNVAAYAYAQELRRRRLLIYRQQLIQRARELYEYVRSGGELTPEVKAEYEFLVRELGDDIFGLFTNEENDAIMTIEQE